MLILKSLYHSLASLRISDAELVRHALKSLSVKRLLCSFCDQTGCLKIQNRYHRYCIHAVNGRRVEETVSIPLLVCSGCGASHAVLPDALIPFGSYSVRFVLTMLRAFASRRCTVADFCDQWQLSQSTVYDWRRRLDSQLSEWISACQTLLRHADSLAAERQAERHAKSQHPPASELIPGFSKLFHQSFQHAFLEKPAFLPETLCIDDFSGESGTYDRAAKRWQVEKFHCIVSHITLYSESNLS